VCAMSKNVGNIPLVRRTSLNSRLLVLYTLAHGVPSFNSYPRDMALAIQNSGTIRVTKNKDYKDHEDQTA